MVRASDLRSIAVVGSTPGQATIKLPRSAFHPPRVGKSSAGLVGWGYGEARSLVSGGR